MTHPNPATEDNKARAFFTACLAIGAGFAGLAVAGLVLGFDYLLHGEPDERDRLAQQRDQRRRDRYADALAWLENDRLDRERARKAKRDWFAADPANRGASPSGEESVGRVAARVWNNLFAGWRRFANGWRAGRDAARERREAGDGNWWRPRTGQRPNGPEQAPTPDTDQGPAPTPDPQPQPTPTRPAPDIIDAEIVPDEEMPASRDVVPVGQDQPVGPGPDVASYQRRIANLENEVSQTRNGHHPDTSQRALN